jgi:hypothetical protein
MFGMWEKKGRERLSSMGKVKLPVVILKNLLKLTDSTSSVISRARGQGDV